MLTLENLLKLRHSTRLMKLKRLLLLLCIALGFSALSKPPKIKTGFWYTSIKLNESASLPILIEVSKENKKPVLAIINGSERILLEDISFQNDSLFIPFPAFASEFRAKVNNKKYITGNWYNHAKKGNYFLPFWSRYEYAPKYPVEEKSIDVAGKWEVKFGYDEEHPDPAIGVFNSASCEGFDGSMLHNRITGTFLTETGDYRFLEGATSGDSLYLSTFDGSHAFLFRALLKSDTLWGDFLSGNHYQTTWYAVRNENYELGNPDSLTYLKDETPITFTLPNVTGGNYTYPNDELKGKVTLIQIMGTWCPNCLDESMYLKEVYNKHQGDLEIVAVTFETQKELDAKLEKVRNYKTKLDLPYTFLVGGKACKPCATELFPMLSEILSFPTLIFIDKEGTVRKIHTGFSGPGTGDYYEQFVSGTNEFIELLINE